MIVLLGSSCVGVDSIEMKMGRGAVFRVVCVAQARE